ncbi:MAG: Ribosomal protein S3, eukaryotic/archaeal [Candidatus Syntrophoarchaeum caldarius]|uniref:Small ribosomal subunit protein uS3 n=1 Tax=Candidatus Syntropharchaeum caldarium TaxID=1838285 RepID=A0A1F2P858_9EURY|nr:MAG: Ribosomal protein S3, eukaryotic/archaeal [Candidatus Syntrophoarchaeum caldarius]
MAIEKKFVEEGYKTALLDEYFLERLSRQGYGGMEINRTPLGTQITVYAERPGMVIGKAGKTIRRLTTDIIKNFNYENPQIDVQEVPKNELNALMMATRLANVLERGWYFRKAAHSTLRQVMDAGALGCEVILSGKLTGPRSRTEKVVEGYMKHAGKPAEDLVNKGFAIAKRKLGVIGVSVWIVPPDAVLPDAFEVLDSEETVISENEEKEEVEKKEDDETEVS